MPWINDKIYLETELGHLTDTDLCTKAMNILHYHQYYHIPEMPEIPNLLAEMQQTKDALSRLIYLRNFYERTKNPEKEKSRLRKKLLLLLEQWGIHCVREIIAGRLHYYDTGFGYFDLDRARKPGPATSFWVSTDQDKGLFQLFCQKKIAILTWFHWEASEDGGNTWIKLGKTRTPHHSTKKPDLNKPYRFRMYASNPKGKSEVAYWEYRG